MSFVLHKLLLRGGATAAAAGEVSGAALLASGYAQAFALDFTDDSAYIKDTGTPANDTDTTSGLSLSSLLTYTAPSLKMTMGPSGTVRFGAHNLLTYSDDISNAAWIATNTTKTDFETLTLNAGTAAKHLYQSAFMTSGLEYEYSCEIKPDGHQYVQILNNGDAAAFANFDVLAGSVGTVGAKTTATITATDAGYYKCSVRWASSASLGTQNRIYGVTNLTSGFAAATSATGALKIRRVHLRRTPSDDTYMATASAARYALPLEWDTAGNPLGLLVEEARTNLVTDWDSATGSAGTVTANQATSRRGIAEMFKFTPNNATALNSCFAYRDVTLAASTTYTFSADVQQAGHDRVQILCIENGTANYILVTFSLTTGAIVSALASVGNFTGISASARLVDTDTWRVTVTYTTGTLATSTTVRHRIYSLDSVDTNGDGTSGIYAWALQVEAGAFETSPIETTGSAVTRAADNISKATSGFPYSATAGTLYVNIRYLTATAGNHVAGRVSSLYGAGTRVLDIYPTSGDVVYYKTSDAEQVTIGTFAQSVRVALAYASDDYSGALNGTLGGADTSTSGVAGSITTLGVGQFAGGEVTNGHIKQLLYVPERLSNAVLQSLTGA